MCAHWANHQVEEVGAAAHVWWWRKRPSADSEKAIGRRALQKTLLCNLFFIRALAAKIAILTIHRSKNCDPDNGRPRTNDPTEHILRQDIERRVIERPSIVH